MHQPPLDVRWYALGAGDHLAKDLSAGMIEMRTAHLVLLATRGSPAERDLGRLGAEREAAVKTIADVLGVDFVGRVRMVFYPDSATKARATGHIGMGLAFDRNIVEIYSDRERLDPYHELTHIIASDQGDPPALLNEGLATYMTQRLGADALRYLGHPGVTANVVVCQLVREQQLIPLDSILHFRGIGPAGTNGAVSYPEAASLVQFLVERRGLEKLREAYRRLTNSADPADWRANELLLQTIYGVPVRDLERQWLASLGCPAAGG